ncbi:MAG: acyl-CoA dehydrogenase family protein, partial [Pseudomonadales bacterium]
VLLVIDTNAAGVSKTAVFNSIDGSNHAAYAFDQVQVPASHMIGQPGEGMPRALGQIGDTRLAIASTCVGHMRWVYAYVSDYLAAPDRSGKPRGNAPIARLRLGEMFSAAYAARSMLYRTARLVDSGTNAVNEAMATKVHATNALTMIVDEAIQIVGGSAVVDSHPLAQLYKSTRSLRLTEGATDVLLQNVARGTLDLGKGSI